MLVLRADIRGALEAGARGYLLKEMLLTDVIRAVSAVHQGERVIPNAVAARLAQFPERSTLTQRELEVLELVAKGLSNKDVADRTTANRLPGSEFLRQVEHWLERFLRRHAEPPSAPGHLQAQCRSTRIALDVVEPTAA